MRLKWLMIVALLTSAVVSFAQEENDDYELRGTEKEGWIIDKDGKKVEGIVKLMGTAETPWVNQKKVRFIAKSDIDATKKRQKFKTLDVDDLNGYAAYDGDSLRRFAMIKYVNKREAAQSGSGLGGDIKMIKNMSNTTYMAETIIRGPVTVYRLYGMPAAVAVGKKQAEEMENDLKRIRENPSILVSKNGGKVEELNSSDMKKFTEDCEYVRNKMLNGEYAGYKPEKEEKKKSKVGALIKSEAELNSGKVLNMAKEIFTDYNNNCAK